MAAFVSFPFAPYRLRNTVQPRKATLVQRDELSPDFTEQGIVFASNAVVV